MEPLFKCFKALFPSNNKEMNSSVSSCYIGWQLMLFLPFCWVLMACGFRGIHHGGSRGIHGPGLHGWRPAIHCPCCCLLSRAATNCPPWPFQGLSMLHISHTCTHTQIYSMGYICIISQNALHIVWESWQRDHITIMFCSLVQPVEIAMDEESIWHFML